MEKHLEKLETDVVDNVMMTKLANAGIVIIRKRTLKGQFLEGSSADASRYSTKPFTMPLGAASKFLHNKLSKEKSFKVFKGHKESRKEIASVQDTDYKIFKSKRTGNLWVLFKGGYRQYRQMAGKDVTNTSLTWSGRMLRNLGIIKAENKKAEIDFKSPEEQQKAAWQTLLGAGKSKRKHVFMNFTKDEVEQLVKLAEDMIAKKIK